MWCIAVTLMLAHAFADVGWSYVDTATNLTAAGDTRSWREVASDSLTKSAEYRPMLDLGTRLAYRIIGLNLGVYHALVILQFALILTALLVMFRATGGGEVVAAIVALSIAVGLHTSRILFLFVPLNAYSTSMLIVLAVALLALMPRRGWHEWVLLPLTLLGLLWLELAILIVPIVLVAWLMKAPGTTWRSLAASGAGLAIYLVARLGFAPALGMSSPNTGLGFSSISPEESTALFAHAPWLLWIYNSGSTLLTVLASEPRAGVFRLIESLLQGRVPLWMWIHVLSSVATTVLLCVALPGIGTRPSRDRLIAAFGAVLMVGGSALAFLYTRDRIGLPVGIGYAMITYVALSAMLERRGSAVRRVAVAALVTVLGVCWSIRTAEGYVTLRDTALDYHTEWGRPEAIALATDTVIGGRMRAEALQRQPPDPLGDPEWTYKIFERRFTPPSRNRED